MVSFFISFRTNVLWVLMTLLLSCYNILQLLCMYLSKIEKYMRKKKTFLVSIIGLSCFHVVDRILGKKWKMA